MRAVWAAGIGTAGGGSTWANLWAIRVVVYDNLPRRDVHLDQSHVDANDILGGEQRGEPEENRM